MVNAIPTSLFKTWKKLQFDKQTAMLNHDPEGETRADALIVQFAQQNSISLSTPVTEDAGSGTPGPTAPPKPTEGTIKGKNQEGWGANLDPAVWKVTNMINPPTKFKVVDDKGINVVTEFTTQENAQGYIDYYKWLKDQPDKPPGGNGEPQPGKEDVDKFGIRKIFPDASSGKFETNFKLEEKERHYQSGKPSEWSTEYTNVSKDVIQNQEVTIYEKVNGFKKEPDTVSLKLGGPDHHDGARFWVIPDFGTDGNQKRTLEIEDPHPHNHSIDPKPLTKFDSIIGKWFGYKGISYQNDNGTRHVESWIHFPVKDIDKVTEEQDKWQKYMEYDTDKKYFKFLGKNTTSRLDGPKKGDPPTFQYASVREIEPPKK